MLKLDAALRRRWPILAVLTLIGLVMGAVSGHLADDADDSTPRHRASQVVIARKSAPTVLVPQDTLKITRGQVLEVAAETLGEPVASDAARGVTTTYDSDQASITITCVRDEADDATACTQAFVDAFLQIANEDSQQDEVLQLAQIRKKLDETREARDALLAQNPPSDDPNQPADPADPDVQQQRQQLDQEIDRLEAEHADRELQLARATPYESLGAEPAVKQGAGGSIAIPASAPVRGGVLAVIGLLVGGIIVLVLERAYPRIDSRDDLLEVTDLPILTEVGYFTAGEQPFRDGSIDLDGSWAEPYRRLRAAVRFMQAQGSNPTGETSRAVTATDPTGRRNDPGGRAGRDGRDGGEEEAPHEGRPLTILITSTVPGEGKSTTSALLGLACAEHDNTIVVSADFRRPAVDRLLGRPPGPTLHERAQLNTTRPSLTDLVLRTEHERLYLVSAGPGTREVAGRLEAARTLLRSFSGNATLIVDTSPLAAASDALDLLDSVDYTILTVRAGAITEKQLAESIDVLTRMGTPIMGIVLIASRARRREQQLYHEYYAED